MGIVSSIIVAVGIAAAEAAEAAAAVAAAASAAVEAAGAAVADSVVGSEVAGAIGEAADDIEMSGLTDSAPDFYHDGYMNTAVDEGGYDDVADGAEDEPVDSISRRVRSLREESRGLMNGDSVREGWRWDGSGKTWAYRGAGGALAAGLGAAIIGASVASNKGGTAMSADQMLKQITMGGRPVSQGTVIPEWLEAVMPVEEYVDNMHHLEEQFISGEIKWDLTLTDATKVAQQAKSYIDHPFRSHGTRWDRDEDDEDVLFYALQHGEDWHDPLTLPGVDGLPMTRSQWRRIQRGYGHYGHDLRDILEHGERLRQMAQGLYPAVDVIGRQGAAAVGQGVGAVGAAAGGAAAVGAAVAAGWLEAARDRVGDAVGRLGLGAEQRVRDAAERVRNRVVHEFDRRANQWADAAAAGAAGAVASLMGSEGIWNRDHRDHHERSTQTEVSAVQYTHKEGTKEKPSKEARQARELTEEEVREGVRHPESYYHDNKGWVKRERRFHASRTVGDRGYHSIHSVVWYELAGHHHLPGHADEGFHFRPTLGENARWQLTEYANYMANGFTVIPPLTVPQRLIAGALILQTAQTAVLAATRKRVPTTRRAPKRKAPPRKKVPLKKRSSATRRSKDADGKRRSGGTKPRRRTERKRRVRD